MSAQTKKGSKKNKLSPNENELENQFHAPQRVKSSRATKTTKNFNTDGKDGQENMIFFSKESIPYIDKNFLLENSMESKDSTVITLETTVDNEDGISKTMEELKMSNEETEKKLDISTVLSDDYMPSKHLFREQEAKDIVDFISRCVVEDQYQSLLVSGNPGTGKSIVLTHLLKKLEEEGLPFAGEVDTVDGPKWVNENREVTILNMNANNSESLNPIVLEIIRAINEKVPLSVADYKNNSKMLIDKLKQLIMSKRDRKTTIVMIDEADTLLGKSNIAKEFAELLRVPRYPFSNLVIIAVTNIPDFSSSFAEKAHLEVEQTTFKDYTKEEMVNILQNRFEALESTLSQTLDSNPFENINIEGCVRIMPGLKDADPRQILRIFRKTINKSKASVSEQTTMEIEGNSQAKSEEKPIELSENDLLNVYQELYDDSLSERIEFMTKKHLMCLSAIAALLTKNGGEITTKKDMMNMYNNICGRLFLPRVDTAGVSELIGLLESEKILEERPKEVEVEEKGKKKANKQVNEEYNVLITPERIRKILQQDAFFRRSYPEE